MEWSHVSVAGTAKARRVRCEWRVSHSSEFLGFIGPRHNLIWGCFLVRFPLLFLAATNISCLGSPPALVTIIHYCHRPQDVLGGDS